MVLSSSLEEAIKLAGKDVELQDKDLFPGAMRISLKFARDLKNQKGLRLSLDEVAAIHFYTQEIPFYRVFNSVTRHQDPERLPNFLPFHSLLMSGLNKLPKAKATVFRGIKHDFPRELVKNDVIEWKGFSSAAINLSVLNDEKFYGLKGERMLFVIETQNGVNISEFSANAQEKEVLLLPGTLLKVNGILNADENSKIVHLLDVTNETPTIPMPQVQKYETLISERNKFPLPWLDQTPTLAEKIVVYIEGPSNAQGQIRVNDSGKHFLQFIAERTGKYVISFTLTGQSLSKAPKIWVQCTGREKPKSPTIQTKNLKPTKVEGPFSSSSGTPRDLEEYEKITEQPSRGSKKNGAKKPKGKPRRSQKDPSLISRHSIIKIDKQRCVENIVLGPFLGKGATGYCYQGYDKVKEKLYAVKEIIKSPSESEASCFTEIQFMEKLNHPGIVNYQGYKYSKGTLYLLYEYLGGGALDSKIPNGGLSEKEVKRVMRRILEALSFTHKQGLVHGDIKGGNILFDEKGNPKLIDFSEARDLSSPAKTEKYPRWQGTTGFMAPEKLSQTGYFKSSDIWSLGILFLHMVTGEVPLCGYPVISQPPAIPETLSPEAVEFAQACLQVNPAKRLTANELLNLPFMI